MYGRDLCDRGEFGARKLSRMVRSRNVAWERGSQGVGGLLSDKGSSRGGG